MYNAYVMTISKKTSPKAEKPKSTLEWILMKVESYLKQNPHLTDSGFGLAAVQDTNLVKRLRAGHDITTRKLDLLVKYMGNSKDKEENDGK